MTQYLMTHACYDKGKHKVFEKGKIYAEGDFSEDQLRQFKEHKLAVPAPGAQTVSAPLDVDAEGNLIAPQPGEPAAEPRPKPEAKAPKAKKPAAKADKKPDKKAEKAAKKAAKSAPADQADSDNDDKENGELK